MQADYDLVIRGGTIADGRIAAIGAVSGRGTEEIDARGRVVTPGFIDVHTHYDGQCIWAEELSPSSAHGVTTAVMGNCGVGFAPCRKADHQMLINVMEGVEDIPGVVIVRRQRPLDRIGVCLKGGIWSHRSDDRNADESKFLKIESACQGPCRTGSERHSARHPAAA